MRRSIRIAQTALLSLVLIVALVGCKGQRARVALNKSQEIVAQLEDLNAQTHAPQRLDQLRTLIDQTSTSLEQGADAQAFETARQAKELAESTLIEVETAEARALWNKAQEDIRVADTNGVPRIDPARYQRIRDLFQEANQAREENEFRDVIRITREISQEVETAISPIKNESDRARIEAEQKLQELKAAGGQIYDPESVINVQDVITRAVTVANEERDYVLAANQFREAINSADTGLVNVKRLKGQEAIERIEQLLATALDEGARNFRPEDYSRVEDLLETLITDFNEGNYTRVELSARDLEPRAELLVLNTKRDAADDRIQQLRDIISDLVDAGAREYLPGRVEELDAVLANMLDIRQADTEAAFDEIRVIFNQAENEAEQIAAAFEALADDAIRVASQDLDRSRAVFEEASQIFAPMENVPADMRPFESTKEAKRIQLREEIRQAGEALDEAEMRKDNGRYRSAILLAEEQESNADQILSEIYNMVSGNAVIELSNLISRYERDGARIYAAEELSASVADLDRVKEAREAGEYQVASQIAAEARANIELMARRISGRATENLREARELYEEISAGRTAEYSASMLQRVKQLLDQAEQDLSAGRLKIALETANEAAALAREARTEADMQAAQIAIADAESKIDRAQAAGAARFSGRELDSARNLFQSAQSLFSSNDYSKAEELALRSAEQADQAFYKQVNEAEAAIADAKAVGGWEYATSDLSEASAEARTARRLLEQGSYEESRKLANSARKEAESVARSTKRNNYLEAVDRIEENLAEGTQQGINYFQVGDSVDIRRELTAIQDRWTLDDYDMIMAELNALEGSLRAVLDSTPEVVNKVADQQEERLEFYADQGAADYAADLIESARANLKYARLDYRNGLYKRAHSSLTNAIGAINEISSRYAQEEYADEIEQIFSDYMDAQHRYRNVLSLAPAEMKALAFGSNTRGNMVAISGNSTPAEFRADVELLYSQAILLDPPAEMARVHESVIQALNTGRIAAIHFERFIIMNEASNREAERLVDTAYEQINRSNATVAELQRQFFRDEINFRLVTAGGGASPAVY